ncbi:hypothetical protein [Actinophytocola oryzae]|uniref:Excreted virulence factor EspC (Type VII ESX diderm) n=1 Tax=Actinophytocola oryzae TaxID=502181 RepID=A0A4R7UZ83_9PSEU|nr:hypothetical protein [Actinophytocola oryzae]TDV41487.1 hypothetical protein CLV71_120177 [Actinophytocola oryzae]
MTHDDQPPPPPPPGYDADGAAFDGFRRGYRPLADDLHDTTRTNLDAHTSMDGNAFSRVGRDVGLSDAVRNATRSQLDRVNGLAGNTTAMDDAVAGTWTNYESLEDEHDRRIRRAIGEIT